MTPETWDAMIPHFLQNVSPAGREFLRRATQSDQPTSQFFSIGAGELEGWTLRFLASLADTPSWENTISLVNEHHQTLAHLAVLFRYTTLLNSVAQWGIDVDVQDVNGFTALHCAYLCGDLDSVEVLKSYGADEDIEDNLGRRPLDMYIPSTNDLGRGSPSSDCTSRSSQRPNTSEGDWERVSMASSQPGSLGNHETTMDLPTSRHQSLHTRDLTTSSNIIPTSLSMPSPTGGNSFLTDDWEMIEGVSEFSLSDSSSAPEHTQSFPLVPGMSKAILQYTPREVRETRHLILDARQMDVALTTSDLSSPQPFEDGATRQPTLAPLLLPQTQTPENDHFPSTRKEEILLRLELKIKSSPWYAFNALEPPCASPECPYPADRYGVRGMSCYSAFVTTHPAGTFGCWRCHAYSTRKLEDAIKHQRSDHFNHKPFLCVPTTGNGW